MAIPSIAFATRRSLVMGPSVRSLLNLYCLKAEQITSTGPHQTLLKGDVLDYVNKHQLKPGESRTHEAPSKPKQMSTSHPVAVNYIGNLKATVFRISDSSIIRARYARKYPSQQEIDVINNGGHYQ